MGDVEVMAAAATPAAGAKDDAKEDESSLHALQQHLQLEAFEGKYLTSQEILLVQLYQSLQSDSSANGASFAVGGDGGSLHVAAASSSSGGVTPANAATTPGGIGASGKSSATLTKAGSFSGAATPKRQLSSDRERVQNFLLQRQGSVGSGINSVGAPTPRGSTGANTASPAAANGASASMSAIERAKLVMAKKAAASGGAKPLARSTSNTAAPVKRVNPLADILKGGSGSVVGGVQANIAKRQRTKSDLRPGEIRLNGGRGTIQLPVESFLRSEDWDSATASALDIVLPEVAFMTNNTLIIHATMPQRSMRFCFNISTQASMLSGAPYPGTVLYHFNPRRQRGGQIIQNSNIDGRWGCSQPLPRCPITFGEPFTLRLTIVSSGFLVFIEEIFQDEFKHRVPIREGENLVLTVPTRDENGNPEGVIVHNVWWGHAEPPANIDALRRGPVGGGRGPGGMGYRGPPRSFDGPRGFDGDRGGGGYRGDRGDRGGPGGGPSSRFGAEPHPFEVYVGNLPPGTSREDLSFLFQYLGYETVRITQRGFGFVTLRSAEDMNRAVEDLDGRDFNGMKLKVSVAMAPK